MKKILLYICIAFAVLACDNDGDSNQQSASSDTGKAGSLARFTVVGNYMYTVDYSTLKVFNLNTPENPVLVNTVNIGFDIETLFSYKEYLYIGSNSGMYIYGITSPENPNYISQAQHFTSCDPVVANDTYAYVSLHSETWCGNNINSLEIYDVTDVSNPVFISSRNLTYPKGIGLYQNYLIVCDDEVKIFDVTNPENSTLAASINREVFDVIVNGDHLILIGDGGLFQYQLDPESIGNIQELSSISI